jgi:hypothetical protein
MIDLYVGIVIVAVMAFSCYKWEQHLFKKYHR